MTQIVLVQIFTTVNQLDLSAQEEVTITFAPDNDDVFT
jgi:hypothetical protein